MAATSFDTFAEVKKTFNTADHVAPHIVFDLGGNNFHVITVIHFNRQKLYIRHVLTHAEYDKWNKANRSKTS